MVFEYIKREDGLYVCPQCGETKRLQTTMYYHMKKHTGKFPYECHHCKKGFLHASTRDLHIKAQHEKVEEKMYRCPGEGCTYKGTLTKANLLIHYIRKHCKAEAMALLGGDKDSATCKGCSKVCNSMTSFHYHVAGCMKLSDTKRQEDVKSLMGS